MAESFDKMKVEFMGHEESVQALAATFHDSGEVPERYIRPEIDAEPLAADAEGNTLPTIDLSRLLDPEFSQEESAKLGSACEHWGFFQLVNHGVDGGLLRQTKADIAEFFGLPLEEKSAVAIPPNGMQGFGHHFVFSKEQKLDWVDLLFLATRPAEERSLDFWPTKPPTFRSIEHRAVVNPDKEGITIATFHSVHLPCTIGPFQELGDASYKTIDGGEFTKGYFAAKLEGRRYLESLKL